MKWFAAVLVLVVTACAEIPEVQLQDPETGRVVTCFGYFGPRFHTYEASMAEQRRCVEDYEAEGFVRL